MFPPLPAIHAEKRGKPPILTFLPSSFSRDLFQHICCTRKLLNGFSNFLIKLLNYSIVLPMKFCIFCDSCGVRSPSVLHTPHKSYLLGQSNHMRRVILALKFRYTRGTGISKEKITKISVYSLKSLLSSEVLPSLFERILRCTEAFYRQKVKIIGQSNHKLQ